MPPYVPLLRQPEPEPEPEPTSWNAARRHLRRGYFNPFAAFETGADWNHFKHAQFFLILLSLVGPWLTLLLMDFISALLYQAYAALQSITPPNPFYELVLYRTAWILAKGNWVTYLVFPPAVLALGWLWAAASAWNLSRDSDKSFGQCFCALAMVASMFAPFTMFPFIRLLALAGLTVYVARTIQQDFSIPFFHFLKRGGIFLIALAVCYTWIERRVEAFCPIPQEVDANLNAFLRSRRKLEWPSLRAARPASPFQEVLDGLNSLDNAVRDQAIKKGTDILKGSGSAPEARFGVALRLAELRNTEGLLFVTQAYRTGQGVPQDGAKALTWMQELVKANPSNLDYGLNLAALQIQEKHALEGKRAFVRLAKLNMKSLEVICRYLEKAGLGAPENTLTWDIKNLYTQSRYYDDLVEDDGGYDSAPRYRCFTPYVITQRQNLLARLGDLDSSGNQWFFRALLTEFGNANPAPPEAYGEKEVVDTSAETLGQISQNDPTALTQAGDHLFDKGDVLQARNYWQKATTALQGDARTANGPLYYKLAESYDPGGQTCQTRPAAKATANSHLAIRNYLGFLLVTIRPGSDGIQATGALKRLGTPVPANLDTRSTSFITLCARHDVPEAWVMLGCEHLGGGMGHLPRNPSKAKECFQKARNLGYQGPALHQLD